MFITEENSLKKYGTPYRLWQGIPGIEVTKKGRIFSTFYSGGIKEEVNNFVVLLKSDDGIYFGEPIAVVFEEGYRCYDPCLWIDPLGRLWLFWACAPEHAVYAVICDDPDADELVWSDVIRVGEEVMMNKPTVLTTGEWLFPIAVWHRDVQTGGFRSNKEDLERKAFAYKTVDHGKSFVKLGGADLYKRSFDEHMILEMRDSSLAMFVRTTYGIGVSYSYDGGKHWTKGENSGLGGPCSRFFIGRLKSGRILLINHYNYTGRSHLTAMLSEDECKTWKYKLLLDERAGVSYPDAKECDDGYIYVTYDRERGAYLNSIDEVYSKAREVLFAKITENDIMSGTVVDPGSKLRCIISKLGKYDLESENPFEEVTRFSSDELVRKMSEMSQEELLDFIFGNYGINCNNMHMLDNIKLDSLIEQFGVTGCNKGEVISKILSLIYSVGDKYPKEIPIVSGVKSLIQNNLQDDVSVKIIAQKLGVSMYYMCHLFKQETGITIVDYKKEMRIIKAKNLLVNTDKKITDIAQECGFGGDSYFCKVFAEHELVSPSQYRDLCKKKTPDIDK